MDYVRINTVKPLSGQNIIEHNACKSSADKFVKKFGYFNDVEWTEEVETWIKENISDGINWLIENDFIKRVDSLDLSKLLFFKTNGSIYKLCRISSNEYQWCGINVTNFYYGSDKFNSIEHAVDEIKRDGHKIKSFDSVEEALIHFNGIDTLSLAKIIAEKIPEDDIEIFCDAFSTTDLCNIIKCSECPFE